MRNMIYFSPGLATAPIIHLECILGDFILIEITRRFSLCCERFRHLIKITKLWMKVFVFCYFINFFLFFRTILEILFLTAYSASESIKYYVIWIVFCLKLEIIFELIMKTQVSYDSTIPYLINLSNYIKIKSIKSQWWRH